jgi:exopolysaccharide biosynthesis polyprenyl glycosylphosphotransferase
VLVFSLLLATWSGSAVLAWGVAMSVWGGAGLYSRRFHLSVLDDLPKIALGILCGLAVAEMMPMATGLRPVVPLTALLLGAAVISRLVAYSSVRAARTRSRITYPAVVLGAGHSAVALAHRIADRPATGLRVVGFLDQVAPNEDTPLPLLGTPRDLAAVVAQYFVSDVIVAYGGVTSDNLVDVLRDGYRLPVDIHVMPRFFEMHRLEGGSDHIWGIPLETVSRRSFDRLGGRCKRWLDIVVSGLALLVLAPVIAVVALAVRLDLGPGIFFRQVRVGLAGRPFTIRKFRSMKDLPPGVESPWTVTDAERLGRVGGFIRRYFLDEIPQLYNVLVGDMSLVGPRPERPEYFQHFRDQFPRYGHRSRMLPGLTGLAAVERLRGDTSIEERAYFDNLYIENWSLWLDLKIIVRTAAAVMRGAGG